MKQSQRLPRQANFNLTLMSSNLGNNFIDAFESIDGDGGINEKNSDELISRKIEIKFSENLNWPSTNDIS